jgi:hypothetical protein
MKDLNILGNSALDTEDSACLTYNSEQWHLGGCGLVIICLEWKIRHKDFFEKFPAVVHKDGLLFRYVQISGSTTTVVKLVQMNPN